MLSKRALLLLLVLPTTLKFFASGFVQHTAAGQYFIIFTSSHMRRVLSVPRSNTTATLFVGVHQCVAARAAAGFVPQPWLFFTPA